jgi:hypothetical protein
MSTVETDMFAFLVSACCFPLPKVGDDVPPQAAYIGILQLWSSLPSFDRAGVWRAVGVGHTSL